MDKSSDCAINNFFYDHLLSYKSSEDAINIFRTIKSYLKRCSFNLRMCMSANKEVKLPINVIGENGTIEEFIGDDEKTLGICWGFWHL